MWVQIGLAILSAVVMYLLRPKVESPKPATLEDFNIPKTQEGDEIGFVYGTAWLTSPQVVWFGDFNTEVVKSSGAKK